MSLTMTIVMLISSWLTVAAAMLWGVLRVTRRYQHPIQAAPVTEPDKTAAQHATAH